MRIEIKILGKVIWRWALGRLSIERKAEKKTHRLPLKVSLLKLPFKYFTTVIDMNIINLGIKVVIFKQIFSVGIKYVLGTVIMLETNII